VRACDRAHLHAIKKNSRVKKRISTIKQIEERARVFIFLWILSANGILFNYSINELKEFVVNLFLKK